MQPLSAPKSDLLFLPYLFHLECNHHPERLSDNVILRREPKNLEILRAAQDDNYSLRGACPELAEGLRMTVAGIRLVVGQPLPFVFVRKKCKTSGTKFA